MTSPPYPPVTNSAYSRSFVLSMIGLTFLMFFCAAGFIAYRWLITTEPSALLIVQAPNLLSGAKISVRSVEDSTSRTAIVGERNYFSVPFYLDPGSYTIQITLDDKDIYKADFTLRHFEHQAPEHHRLIASRRFSSAMGIADCRVGIAERCWRRAQNSAIRNPDFAI